jgi:hypothetical protein
MPLGANDNAAYLPQAALMSGLKSSPSDAWANGAFNAVSGFGMPMVQGALGMMGLDPISMAMRAGTAALGSGMSMGGAMAIGAGVGLPAMALGAGAMYGANRMFEGAQQQSQINTMLRSNFGFANQQGGYGFTRGDQSRIGSDMRQMSHELGPLGEMTSMRELTQLGSKMGQTGAMSGVRDAKQFADNFKKTIDTLKQVATTLNTSLEGAMEFVNSSKSSGMFKAADQMRFANGARGAAVGGGVAMSEVTGMANIGSQISRSVGGLGRQGAFGGMAAIAQVGGAVQSGVLSEEDIYNATGQTGAEGRQAMAAGMMQQSARFLSGGRGRRFLASVAGKDGQLNEAAVAEWMAGDVGTGRTMQMAQQNLSGVGRANFIRNEGRLRGAALEKFGGMAQTMAYKEWLGSRGIDVNNMDDRSMLAFQRFSGMGRDEADAAVKMVQNMPTIMREQRDRQRDDMYSQRMEGARKTTGIEGMKRKLDQAKEKVNSSIEKVGQDIYNDIAEFAEARINDALGISTSRAVDNIEELNRQARMGGAKGQQINQMAYGKGDKRGLMAGARDAASLGKQMNRKPFLGMFGDSMADKLRASGFSVQGTSEMSDKVAGETFQRDLQKAQAFQSAAAEGGSASATAFGEQNKQLLQGLYASQITGKGEQRLSSYKAALATAAANGDGAAAKELAAFKGLSTAEQARRMSSAEGGAGINREASLAAQSKTPGLMLFDRGKYATLAEEDAALGKEIRGAGAADAKEVQRQLMLGGGVSGGAWANRTVKKSREADKAAGRYMATGEGMELAYGAFSSDKDQRADALARAESKIAGLRSKDKLSEGQQGELDAAQSIAMAARYFQAGGDKMSGGGQKDYAAYARGVLGDAAKGLSDNEVIEQSKKRIAGVAAAAEAKQEANQRAQAEKLQMVTGQEMDRLKASGVLDKSGKVAMTKERSEFKGLAADIDAMLATGKEGLVGATNEAYASGRSKLEKMTEEERTRASRAFAGTDLGMEAAEMNSRSRRFSGLKRQNRGNADAAALQFSGFDLSKEEMEQIKGLSGKEAAGVIAKKYDIKDSAFVDSFGAGLDKARKGEKGASEELFKSVGQSSEAQAKIKEKRDMNDPSTKMAASMEKLNAAMTGLPAKFHQAMSSALRGEPIPVVEAGKEGK